MLRIKLAEFSENLKNIEPWTKFLVKENATHIFELAQAITSSY